MIPNDELHDLERSYSGFLVTRPLSGQEVEEIIRLGRDEGLELDVTTSSIDFEYIGRDTNRFIVKLLQRIARIVRGAEGEIRCQISGDSDNLSFEFFRISDGKVFRQLARLVRLPEEELEEGNFGT